jgi:hypothetical protein
MAPTVMDTAAVFLHPLAAVPVTVYVFENPGKAQGLGQDVQLNPVVGVHTYDTPPPALIIAESTPKQMVALGPAVIVGLGRILTNAVAVFVQPFASVPTTV